MKVGGNAVSAGRLEVCRAIGLPCRSVTNFASAHNTDLDRLSIDVIKKKDKDGSWVDDKSDSVWNFHVWNEVWMRRPDLKEGNEYDGWQVIDATPQELSDGVYCCGPSPVKAIMKGELDIGNDTAFIYAEVNADRVTWKENEKSGRLFEVRRRRNAVGKFISTHKPTGKPFEGKTFGSFLSFFGFSDDLEREDLTDHYKHKEGSEEEKKVNRKAEKLFRQLNGCESEDESDPECEEEEPIELEIEEDPDVLCGNGFDFKIKAKNNGSKTRTMNLELKVLYKTYYDTVTGVALAKSFKEINMKPGDSKSFKVEVSDKLANQRPQDGFCFELKADAEFTETSNIVSEEVDYRLRRPDLTVKGPKKVSLDEIVNVTVSLRNPLKVPLTGCEVDFEGGFKPHGRTKNTFKVSNIQPGSTWETSLQLKASAHPVTCAYRDLNIGFDSNELQDIMGVYSCTVTNLS